MFEAIRKRDGRIVEFCREKVVDAIFRAAQSVGGVDRKKAEELTDKVLDYMGNEFRNHVPDVEEIQDIVEKILIENGHAKTAKAYILYRDKRTRMRDAKNELMDVVEDILKETSRENANIGHSPSSKMFQIASATSKKYYLNRFIPEKMAAGHIKGDYHIHDLDYYNKTLNCLHIPLKKMLESGFNTGHGYIRPPKRPSSATALAAILLQSSQNDMFGGQSFASFDFDMSEFMQSFSEEEVYQAMEALVYNLNSMHSRAGNQVPFSSINLGLDTSEAGRMVTRCFLLAYEKGLGYGENPIFPNVIFKIKKGVNFNEGDPNYDLFQLTLRVASKRMNPTFLFMDAPFNAKFGNEVSTMGCRTRVIDNRHGEAVITGRGNLAFTTINLPRLAIKAKGNMEAFYRSIDEVMDLVAEQLYHRFKTQAKLRVKDLPFVMGQNLYLGSENLKECDNIEPAIKNGSLSIGFIGLAETLTALIGKHHGESDEAQNLGLEIIRYMSKRANGYGDKYDLNYSFFATPAEGLSGRFIAMDAKEFGIIPGVTDGEYYTNSFHVPVSCEISFEKKLEIEGPYHAYCNGGHISYVELSAPPLHNVEAMETIVRKMADCNIGYAGINFPIDECRVCGYSGIIDDACPECSSTSIRRIRRITGYLSSLDNFNNAKKAEVRDRRKHL
ncbi:MAG: anaerobic ribonucleoside-triphosphate reductase [bacterium]